MLYQFQTAEVTFTVIGDDSTDRIISHYNFLSVTGHYKVLPLVCENKKKDPVMDHNPLSEIYHTWEHLSW